jgi:hypothetical protein
MPIFPKHCAVFIAPALLVAAGCGRDDVAHYRVAKPDPVAAAVATAGPAAPAPAPEGRSGLRWTLPPGWTEGTGDAMRHATLRPDVPGRVDVSITVLSGPAGGELANVNRWRGQIALPPLDEDGLAKARARVGSGAGPVSLYDFAGEGATPSRVVAGLLAAGESTWFVKMSGDAAAVGAARADFLRLVESLRLEDRN